MLVVVSGLRLLAALLTAAGSAALLPRLRFALLTAVLLWLPLLRLALLCSTRFLAICRLLLLAALLPLLSLRSLLLRSLLLRSFFSLLSLLLLLHAAFAALRCALSVISARSPGLTLSAILARCTAAVFRSLSRLAFVISLLLILLLLLLTRPRRRLFRLPRRRGGIDLQQLPGRMRDVRLVGPRIHGHATVFERAASTRPEPLRHQLQAAVERATSLTAGQHDLRLCRTTLHPGLDADAGQAEVGIERPHPHRHRRPRWHAGRRFQRLLDRDLGGQICLHVDPVFELLRLHLLPAGKRRAAGLEQQTVGGVLSCRAVGIHLQHERAGRPRQIARPHLELEVAAAVAVKIDPGRLERLVAFGDDHDTRALDAPEVALPRHRLALAPHVGRKLVPHLPHHQRRRIDHRHADRLAPRIARLNRERHRLIEPAGRIRQHGGIALPRAHLATDPCHLRPPRHCRSIDGTAFEHRRDGDDRLLVAPQAADRGRHHELPTADQRGTARIDLDAPGIVRIASISVASRRVCAGSGPDRGCLFPGHPPSQPRWLEPHPRRRRHTSPRSEEPGGGGQQTLRSDQRVDAGQPHQRSQRIRQPHCQRAIDDRLRRH